MLWIERPVETILDTVEENEAADGILGCWNTPASAVELVIDNVVQMGSSWSWISCFILECFHLVHELICHWTRNQTSTSIRC